MFSTHPLRASVVALALVLAVPAALAAPDTYTLPEPTAQFRPAPDAAHAPGLQAAQENCLTCHSADYIAMQPPKKGQAFWDAEVAKMIKVYRAPLADDQAKAIAAYLGAAY